MNFVTTFSSERIRDLVLRIVHKEDPQLFCADDIKRIEFASMPALEFHVSNPEQANYIVKTFYPNPTFSIAHTPQQGFC